MNRLFGTRSKDTKADAIAALNKVSASTNESLESAETKIAAHNAELAVIYSKMNKLPPGRAKQNLRRDAIKVLTRRKQQEALRERHSNNAWMMDNARGMTDSSESTIAVVGALNTANKNLRKQLGKVDLDKIERIRDELDELQYLNNDIQEALSWDVPEDVDEEELDAELEALGQDVELEAEMGAATGVPSFMQDEVPEFIDEAPETESKVQEVAR
ncbi:charged multivesicular body protein 5 [Sporothrix brasiliensis 5110]|uniref:Charged multivesicular body protein 5 n=1 Tax=Sporothrix brasiliensis 5110 TaxID=1398154 RepID=A0A0C2IT42_9PEZI|nr:charged multivesicular body protein 5 [Sporothrix brasiliensis 5110]KIH90030.1 charged multivesicular body protein 5 [Sporothrix brasiliensis 5110]